MFAVLFLAVLITGLVYLATFKLRRLRRIAIAAITFALLGVFPIAFVLFNQGLVSCWAYYDQCTAKRVSGLSAPDCLKRDDAVAYLSEGGICLVNPD
jgi:hypothetical protein